MKFAKLMMAAVVAVGTMFMVTGCGESPTEESPTKAYQNYINAVKNGDLNTVNKYLGAQPPLTLQEYGRLKVEIEKLENLTVEKEEIKGNEATLTTSFSINGRILSGHERLMKINGVWLVK